MTLSKAQQKRDKLRRTGLCVRLGFRGYRVFYASPPNFKLASPGTSHMLHYEDFNLLRCDLIAQDLGYFPNAEQMGRWAVERAIQKDLHNCRYRLAFVNSGEYELLYMEPWYTEHREDYLRKSVWAAK